MVIRGKYLRYKNVISMYFSHFHFQYHFPYLLVYSSQKEQSLPNNSLVYKASIKQNYPSMFCTQGVLRDLSVFTHIILASCSISFGYIISVALGGFSLSLKFYYYPEAMQKMFFLLSIASTSVLYILNLFPHPVHFYHRITQTAGF